MPNTANVPADIKKIQADEATLATDTATLAADAAASVTPTPTPPAPPSGSTTPAYSPPGGVGALLWNFDASTLPNGALSSPLLQNTWVSSTMNNVTTSASNVEVVNGQLVLTLSDAAKNGVGACVNSANASNSFFTNSGYFEAKIVVPTGGWWALWMDGEKSWPGNGEFDIAENGFFNGGSNGVGISSSFVYAGNTSGQIHPAATWSPQPTAGETVVIGGLIQPGTAVTSYMNGVQRAQFAGSYVTSGPFCVVANIGYNGTSGANGDTLKISYMRVWALG